MKTKTNRTLKKLLSIALCLALVMSYVPMVSFTVNAAATDLTVTIDTGASVTLRDADGDNYYDIGTADELYAFAAAVNGGFTTINGEQTANITVNQNVLNEDGQLNGDVSDFRVWTPIGNGSNQYDGTFYGDAHTITGLYFDNINANYIGLFGCVGLDGKVQGVGIIKSYFNGGFIVGGVVGSSNGTVINCYNTGSVRGNSNSVGGVIGYNDNIVRDCYNEGAISGGNENAGGVVGYSSSNGTVTNCFNTGSVSGMENVGGVVGYNYSTITSCYNTGSVSGMENVGGVVGYSYSTMTNCYNTGFVSSNGDDVGGVVGSNGGSMTNCYNEGTINGDDTNVGGVVGVNGGPVTSCYNEGTVIGGTNVGGVVGNNFYSNSTVTNCYNTGTVTGYSKYVGGVVGVTKAPITNCYNTGTITGYSNYVGGVVGQKYLDVTVSNCYYLNGCATDGDDVIQFGIGNETVGSTKADVSGQTDSKTADWFASGEVCTAVGYHGGSSTANGFCDFCSYLPPTQDSRGYYEISNGGQLFWFGNYINTVNSKANALLTADIDLEGKALSPIGKAANKYQGIFDGQGHTISNFNMTITGAGNWGLFGYVTGYGTIIGNFSISGDVNTALTSDVDVQYGVVGQADGGAIIRNVHSSVNLTSGDSYQKKYFGGIVGRTGIVTVDRCSFSGTLSLGNNTLDCVGGIAGYVYNGKTAQITNCGFYGSIVSTYSSGNVGGILGYYNGENSKALNISNCLSIGAIPSGRGAVIGSLKNYGSTNAGTNNYYLSSLTHSKSNITATGVTSAQLESGEAAYLLQGGNTEQVWGQNINNGKENQGYPVIGGEPVYCVANCVGGSDYNNTNEIFTHVLATEATCHSLAICAVCGQEYGKYLEHTFTDDCNGFCLVCEGYMPAIKNRDGIYEISNAGQLYWFGALVNGDTSAVPGIVSENDADAILLNDIKVNSDVLAEMAKPTPVTSEFKKWVSIGNIDTNYSGTFDGNNHIISGLFYDDVSVAARANVFGRVFEGAVKNLGIVDSYFSGYYAGALSTSVYNSEITNCYSESVVFGNGLYTAGLIAEAYESEVRNCYNLGKVNGSTYVGGVVAYGSYTTIENCYNKGNVAGSNVVGGVVGRATYSSEVKNSYNTGVVTGEQQSGVVSQLLRDSGVSNCYYLEGTADYGVYEVDTGDAVVCASAEQFASGEVAYLLQQGNTEQVWGQDSNQAGAVPIFDSTGLYKVVTAGETGNYSVANVGDTNGDGTVDVTDYQALVNVALSDGHEQSETAEYDEIIRYDIDGDGYVDALDASLMHLVINGFKTVDVYAVGDYDLNGKAFEEADIFAMAEAMKVPEDLETHEKYACDINGDGKVSYDDLNTLTSMFPLYFVGEA